MYGGELEGAAVPGNPLQRLEFSDHFVFGVPDIDRGHAELIGLLNALIDPAISAATMADLLHRLSTAYTSHCHIEERLLRGSGYDRAREHSQEHSDFNRRLNRCLRLLNTDPGSARAAIVELHGGFADHMLSDLRFKSHLDQKRRA